MVSFEEVEKFNNKDVDKKITDILFEVESSLIENEGRFGNTTNEMKIALSVLVCDFILKTKTLDFYEIDFYQNCKQKILNDGK